MMPVEHADTIARVEFAVLTALVILHLCVSTAMVTAVRHQDWNN